MAGPWIIPVDNMQEWQLKLNPFDPENVVMDDAGRTREEIAQLDKQAQTPGTPKLDFTHLIGDKPGMDTPPVEKPELAPEIAPLEKYPENEFTPLISSSAEKYGVPDELLYRLLKQESQFDPNAVSKKGAKGIAQFMDETAKEWEVDPFNPSSAIPGAARYLRHLYEQTGSWKLALAAYNAGLENVKKYGGVPPFKETTGYLDKIYDESYEAMTEPPGRKEPKEGLLEKSGRASVDLSNVQVQTAGLDFSHLIGGKSEEPTTGVSQGEQDQETGSTVEPPQAGLDFSHLIGQKGEVAKQSDEDFKGLPPGIDLAVGTVETLARTLGDIAFGAGADILRHGAVGVQKVFQEGGLFEKATGIKGPLDKLTPEQTRIMGEILMEDVASLHGLIGKPLTRTGRAGTASVHAAFSALEAAAGFINSGIDQEKYPNAYALSQSIAVGILGYGAGRFARPATRGTQKFINKMTKQIAETTSTKAKAAKGKVGPDKVEASMDRMESFAKEHAEKINEVFNPERQKLVKNEFDVRRQAIKDKAKSELEGLGDSKADQLARKKIKKEEKKALNKLEKEWQETNEQMLKSMADFEARQQKATPEVFSNERIAAERNKVDIAIENIRKSDMDQAAKDSAIGRLEMAWMDRERQMKATQGQSEGLSAAEINQRRMQTIDPMSAFGLKEKPGAVPPEPTLSELSQRTRGFDTEGPVRRDYGPMNKGAKVTKSVPENSPFVNKTWQVSESYPRTTWQVGPDGVQKVGSTGPRSEWKIGPDGKVTQVSRDPGTRTVWRKIEDNGGGVTLASGVDISKIVDLFPKKKGKLPNLKVGDTVKVGPNAIVEVGGHRILGWNLGISNLMESWVPNFKLMERDAFMRAANKQLGEIKTFLKDGLGKDAVNAFDSYLKELNSIKKGEGGSNILKALEVVRLNFDPEGYVFPANPDPRVKLLYENGKATIQELRDSYRQRTKLSSIDGGKSGPDGINLYSGVDVSVLKNLIGEAGQKATSLINTLTKNGMSPIDLKMSGLLAMLREKGHKKVTPEELLDMTKEYTTPVRKTVLGEAGGPAAKYAHYVGREGDPTYREVVYQFDPEGSSGYLESHWEGTGLGKNAWAHRLMSERTHTKVKEQFDVINERINELEAKLSNIDMLVSRNVIKGDDIAVTRDNLLMRIEMEQKNLDSVMKELAAQEGVNSLHIEEIQSVWADVVSTRKKELAARKKELQETLDRHKPVIDEWKDVLEFDADGKVAWQSVRKARDEHFLSNEDYASIVTYNGAIESFKAINMTEHNPFGENWYKPVLRDVVSDAVNSGKSTISWSGARVLYRRWNKKPDFAGLYDKALPKFFKSEFGVKAKGIKETPPLEIKVLDNNQYGVFTKGDYTVHKMFATKQEAQAYIDSFPMDIIRWEVPVTEKMRKMYEEVPVFEPDASLLKPQPEKMFIRHKESTNTYAVVDVQNNIVIDPNTKMPAEFFTRDGAETFIQHEKNRVDFHNKEVSLKTFTSAGELIIEPKARQILYNQIKKAEKEGGSGGGVTLGAGIDISSLLNVFKRKVSPEMMERFRKLARDAEAANMQITEYLTMLGLPEADIKNITSAIHLSKVDRPFSRGKLWPKIRDGVRDPLVLLANERNVNTHKDANPARPIGEQILSEAIDAPVPKQTPIIGDSFVPTVWMHEKFGNVPFIRNLWDKSHAIERAMRYDNELLASKLKDLHKIYPDKKLREEVFIKMMSQDKRGRLALEQSGIAPIDGPIKYDGLVNELNTLTGDLFVKVNETRQSLGLKPIKFVGDYLPIMAHENFLTKVRKIMYGDEAVSGQPNLVLDSPEMITHRHTPGAMTATKFAHQKRGLLKPGVVMLKDPLKLVGNYGRVANKHIHYSPLNSWVKELTTNEFVHPVTGKVWKMKHANPPMHQFLTRWSNKLAGRPNIILPKDKRAIETVISTLNRNLTLSTLGYSVRTMIIQPTALLYTLTDHGPINTIRGIIDTTVRSKKAPVEKSNILANRIAEAGLEDFVQYALESPAKKAIMTPQKYALSFLKIVDAVTAEAAWRAAYHEYKHLGETRAIRMADEAVTRTHGSGFAGDLSPVQMNALGKAVTLWQTFTINQLNYLAKDVFNIKYPERTPIETTRKILTYAIGSAIISSLFEDGLGIQSPLPAPARAIMKGLEEEDPAALVMLDLLLETSEFIPMLSSGKFGSHWLGAPVDYLGKVAQAVKDELPAALEGNEYARIKIVDLIGKGIGIPGTGQITKYRKGMYRGETPAGAVLGRYSE